jgi:hypothetical protein
MAIKSLQALDISPGILERIRSFPPQREVEHCGVRFEVSSFDFYTTCPQCRTRIKLRGFSGNNEIGDIFDAVLEWTNRPESSAVVDRRRREIAEDSET